MTKKEALAAGYEMLTMPTLEKYADDVLAVAAERLLKGDQVVIVKDDYHGEISLTVMVKEAN